MKQDSSRLNVSLRLRDLSTRDSHTPITLGSRHSTVVREIMQGDDDSL
ncbi:MAG: hypothetical protein KDA89_04745 [Planctomycetaceae bacterium]|nr:hypothetical protein [Planctomycetaceae bacterium]